jgi:hypothetical protein
MSADPDVPTDPFVITDTEPVDLPIVSFVNADNFVCLPDGTIVGSLNDNGRDLIQQYNDAIARANAPR